MGPENGRNTEKISYFPIEEYASRIKVLDFVLRHVEETSKNFDEYYKALSKYSDYSVIIYWLSSLKKELTCSQKIENRNKIETIPLDEEAFFDKLTINHQRIKTLHQYLTKGQNVPFDYRETDVRVSRYVNGVEDIYWHGVNASDVKKFMDDFVLFYKSTQLSILGTNPFLKAALTHLLFMRIHPFVDGNGRTARMIHNIKFTDSVNRIYKTNLKVCPLNLSQSILLNKTTYAKKIDNIYFDLEHDSNREINEWFDFILTMADEQLFFNMSRIPEMDQAFENIAQICGDDSSTYAKEIKKMKVF